MSRRVRIAFDRFETLKPDADFASEYDIQNAALPGWDAVNFTTFLSAGEWAFKNHKGKAFVQRCFPRAAEVLIEYRVELECGLVVFRPYADRSWLNA